MAAADQVSLPPVPSRGAPAPGRGPTGLAEGPSAGPVKWLPVFFLSVFAALLASFPARNSNLWVHLASGRVVAQGEYPSGLALRAGIPYRPAVLYDLLCYG